ncbi:MAG: hypothetical protein K6F69_03675 [Treponema sp.]|nr:hypothetical protein [Treponema sp.]
MEVQKNIFNAIFDALVETIKDLFSSDTSVDKIVNESSKAIDQIIIDQENELKLKYVAGKFFIELVDRDNEKDVDKFQLRYQLYFKNEEGKWIESSGASKKYPISNILKDDNDIIEQLIEKKQLSFDIKRPK